MTTTTPRIESITQNANEAESRQSALRLRDSLKPVWGFNTEPDLTGYSPHERAILLRHIGYCYVLTGRDEGRVDFAYRGKQILERSIDQFDSLGLKQDSAEAKSTLGYSYIFEGRIKKASKLIDEADKWLEPESTRYFTNQTNKLMIESWLGNKAEAFKIFDTIKKPISLSGDDNLRAWFNSKVSSMYWFFEDFEKSLFYCEKGIRLSKKARNHRLTATSLNNAAGIYGQLEQYEKAHKLARYSLNMFKTIGSKSGLAHIIDTEAQIYLDEGNYDKAEETIDLAIDLFIETGIYTGRADSTLVKIKILLKQGKFDSAIKLSKDLKNFVLTNLGTEAYRRFHDVLDELLGPDNLRPNQVIPFDAVPVKGFEKRSHTTFKLISGKKEKVIVVVDCEGIDPDEKYVIKCNKSGRFFYGEIHFDPNLELLYINDRPLKNGGFLVVGTVVEMD